ncbi:hypothetical protein, partial [Gemmiger formicilis]
MNLNYCPVPGASQPRGMRFDTENSRCIPTKWMTPDESRQLHRLAIERRPEACFGCGLNHDCSVHLSQSQYNNAKSSGTLNA